MGLSRPCPCSSITGEQVLLCGMSCDRAGGLIHAYLALLEGINVGGKNTPKRRSDLAPDLPSTPDAAPTRGLIQSGNVIFKEAFATLGESFAAGITERISDRFGYQIPGGSSNRRAARSRMPSPTTRSQSTEAEIRRRSMCSSSPTCPLRKASAQTGSRPLEARRVR